MDTRLLIIIAGAAGLGLALASRNAGAATMDDPSLLWTDQTAFDSLGTIWDTQTADPGADVITTDTGEGGDAGGIVDTVAPLYYKVASMSGKTMSDAGIEALKQREGFSPVVYTDSAGYKTIGYGHKLGLGESYSSGISDVEATMLLRSDVSRAEDAVNSLVSVPLTQNQFDALVSFTFNVGAGALRKSSLLSVLNSGNYQAAAQQFGRWKYAGGKAVAGLANRRASESAQFLA